MSDARTALVIGGGIAGPMTAMALRKAGIQATIYASHSATADGVGGGLSIAPNGLNTLTMLGADQLVPPTGTPIRSIVVQSWTGRRLPEFGSLSGLPTTQFAWCGELHRSLHDEATRRGIRTEYGKRLIGAKDAATSSTGTPRSPVSPPCPVPCVDG